MTSKGKIAALVADGFQEEEYFYPKVALQRAGYEVEVLSPGPAPVEMYSFFAPTGKLDVQEVLDDAKPDDYVGILVPGGAKSPVLPAESPSVRQFVRAANECGIMIAAICRGSLLLAKSDVERGKRITGFSLAAEYPAFVMQPDAEAAGATWVNDRVVVNGNLITSRHPDEAVAFTEAMVSLLERGDS